VIIEMQKSTNKKSIEQVIKRIKEMGYEAQINTGEEKVVIAVLGKDTGSIPIEAFEVLSEVEKVFRIMPPYKLASREFKKENTVIRVNDVEVGGNKLVIMAGPCAVESEEQLLSTAKIVRKAGGKVLRGGAYKPSTSPFKFQGMGRQGLEILKTAKEETGLAIATEVIDPRDVDLVAGCADILQIGARNVQNFPLLKEVGSTKKPIILKRGFGSSVDEWLQAADYILERNNKQVILCERGIKTFESSTRFTLDIGGALVVKRFSHLPVIIDPSHAAGNWRYVPGLAKAGLMVSDGLLIEIHPNPKEALKDGPQALTFSDFARLMEELKKLASVMGKEI